MFVHEPIVVPAQDGLECPVCLRSRLHISQTMFQVRLPARTVAAEYRAHCDECGFDLTHSATNEVSLDEIVADAVRAEIERLAYMSGGR